MRALVTGAGGFVGHYLCAYLLDHTNWEILGTVYPAPADQHQTHPRLRRVWADLRDAPGVLALLDDFEPDVLFHLAAQSFVPSSFADPWDTLENNIRSQLNILEAVRKRERAVRVVVIGSNEEYGSPRQDELPITEQSPIAPNNPYAVSKVAQDFLGLQYFLSYGVDVVRLRPFNHTGPGQSPRFVVPAFASQITRVEAGLQEPVLKVGNLDVERDFTDVRDVVRAYYLAARHAAAGEVYNVAAGHPQSVHGLLGMLLSFSSAAIEVVVDPERYRPADAPVAWGSADKLYRCTGWKPEIPFAQTLQDTLVYWRQQVGAQAA
ncbi:MAG: GDP-mannose 4,6-dehydratase [Anaerolineae bacterium]|nr:GDP-mannose 4,6-dehydratase [Anaerolineae bacterium]